ncbi:hypothetical protein [Streptomyces sp. NPDC051572]|uniref:hypothetical protein n=1 Tax=Streptomyces sp. NPDC051572 TaxID=3155802 RepID=UPI00344DA92A
MTNLCFATMDLELVGPESVAVEIQSDRLGESPPGAPDDVTYILHIGDQLSLVLPRDAVSREKLMAGFQTAIAEVLGGPHSRRDGRRSGAGLRHQLAQLAGDLVVPSVSSCRTGSAAEDVHGSAVEGSSGPADRTPDGGSTQTRPGIRTSRLR